jgi:hypothetical protein
MAEGERDLVPRPNKCDRATEGPSRTDVPPTLGNREIIRTKTFVTEAAKFILQRHATRSVRVANSGLPVPAGNFAANYVPKKDSRRLAFTFPLIFAARAVSFLIGASKDPKLIESVVSGDLALPGVHADQNAKRVTWIIEQKS